ncbi:MAG: hypothetical protein JNN15_17450 [Blastocatellia bacterium]|nr:hypothetical protein [Blastocatellia bacterium]
MKQLSILIFLILIFSTKAFSQINSLPPDSLDAPIMQEIFQTTKNLQQRYQALEMKERVAFRLAAVVPSRELRANQNLDFRQYADYQVLVQDGQLVERKLLETHNNRHFGMANLVKQIDIFAIQETIPSFASLQTAALFFINRENVSGYKELEREDIDHHRAIKFEIRFHQDKIAIYDCELWIDEKSREPLRAKVRFGDIDRYQNVTLLINYKHDKSLQLSAIEQEISCATFERGLPIRLEHTVTYSDLKFTAK